MEPKTTSETLPAAAGLAVAATGEPAAGLAAGLGASVGFAAGADVGAGAAVVGAGAAAGWHAASSKVAVATTAKRRDEPGMGCLTSPVMWPEGRMPARPKRADWKAAQRQRTRSLSGRPTIA